MKMTININLDLSGATPKIEVVQEDPKEAEAQEAAGHRPTRREGFYWLSSAGGLDWFESCEGGRYG